MPAMVSEEGIFVNSLVWHGVKEMHTLANDLSVDPPVTNDGEQECQGVDNGDGQAQFWGGNAASAHESGAHKQRLGVVVGDSPALPISKKNHTLPVRLIKSGTA